MDWPLYDWMLNLNPSLLYLVFQNAKLRAMHAGPKQIQTMLPIITHYNKSLSLFVANAAAIAQIAPINKQTAIAFGPSVP
jgi:hypothetical protein